MKELSYSHSPFRREQYIHVLTEATPSCTQGVLLVERGLRARQGSAAFPYSHTHTTPEMAQAGSLGAPWSYMPRETLSGISKARNSTPHITLGTNFSRGLMDR